NFVVEESLRAPLRDRFDAAPGRDVEPQKLFFFPAADRAAAEHLRISLIEGVPLDDLRSLTDVLPQLERHARNGRVLAWGARPGSAAERKWERLNPGDVGLIYADGEFKLWGQVYAKARSETVARQVWGAGGGRTWDCMFFLHP